MFTHPSQDEQAERRACQKMGIDARPSPMTGKQFVALLIVTAAVIAVALKFG